MRRVIMGVAFFCACSGSADNATQPVHKPPPPQLPQDRALPIMGGTAHHAHAHLSPHEPGDHHHHHHPHPHMAGPAGHHHPY
jgi:hypothetical protein